MSDVVVTVPKTFTYPPSPSMKGLGAWISEGDAAGEPWSGQLWSFSSYGARPSIEPGERVYIVCEGRLRGYAPLVRLNYQHIQSGQGRIEFVRGGDAVAVTIQAPITGFRGWRYRWWERSEERPFPDWKV